MMIVNGAATPNINVWCQTVSVTPNTDYAFSTWLASTISAQPAILQFSINSVVLGAPFGASSTLCVWQQFYEIWNSGTATSATICIVNQNTAQSGNDFLLDDISFQPFCSATDTVLVVIDSVPADAGPDTLICKGSLASLNGQGGVTYHWSTGANTQQLNVTLTSPGTFTVTVTNSLGCQGEDSVHVGILPLPTAEAGPHLEICLEDSVLLSASGGINYEWSNGVNSSSQYVSPVYSTQYHVLVTDVNHCSALDSITVFVRPNPMPDLGPDVMVCPGDTVTLTVSEPGTYLWSNGQSSASIGFVFQQNSLYWVEVTNEYGCMTPDTVLVEMQPDGCFFEIPNVFTPNGDGKNDIFYIDYKGLEDYNLKVYNRWGKKVFESANKEDYWDGTISNQPASDGVYYYGLVIGDRKYKGTVTVFSK
jgi:gliding motility-associated-like protein